MEDSQAVNLSSSEPCLFVNNRETPPQPTSRKAAEDLERLTCQNGSFGRNSSLLAVAAQQTYTPWVGTGRVFVVRSSSVIMLSPIVTIFGTGKLLRRGKVKLVDRRMTHPSPDPATPSTKSGGEFHATKSLRLCTMYFSCTLSKPSQLSQFIE